MSVLKESQICASDKRQTTRMDYERKENYKQTTGQVGYVQYSAWEGRGMGIVWLVLQFPRRLTNYSSEFEIQIFLYLDQIHRAYV